MSVSKNKQDDTNKVPHTFEDTETGEPPLEAFEEEEPKNKSSWVRKFIVRMVAAVIAVA